VNNPKRKVKVRITAFMVAFIIFNVYLAINTGKIQVVDGAFLKKEATKQQTRDKIITPLRGTIYDRNMKKLAFNASVGWVTVSPAEIKKAKGEEIVAEKLSEILSLDYDDVYAKITQNAASVSIQRKVEAEQISQIRELMSDNATAKQFAGVYIEEDTKRYYPMGSFASHILGFCGTDNQGLYGIESAYDSDMSGVAGRIITAKNNVGGDMGFKYEQKFEPQDGTSLVLTIDETIQHYAEKHLETAYLDNGLRKGAAVIVINPNTGEILAMASKPDFDLNAPFEINDPEIMRMLNGLAGDEKSAARKTALEGMWSNKALTDTYEPGSVFKIITSAIALEEGLVTVDDSFTCNGFLTVGNAKISCWKTQGHGHETFAQGFQNSCNPVFMEVGARIGQERFYQYYRNFGFSARTGFDVGGEGESIFHPMSRFNEVELATSSFGQSFQVSPLQLVSAVSAVVNGGKLMRPYIVKEYLDKDGRAVKSVEPEVIRHVISEQTSATMRGFMEDVVTIGTGKNAYAKGFRVGGKTGTSEKQPRGTDALIASFLGVAPANKPELLCLVLLDEPTGQLRQGGQIAAPVVRQILEDSLRYMGVEQQFTAEELTAIEVAVPEVRGDSVSEARNQLKETGFVPRVMGGGDTVIDQLPKPGAALEMGSTVFIYTEGAEASNVKVPNVLGMDVSEVKAVLEARGLNLEIIGSTQDDMSNAPSAKQDPPAGTYVLPATTIRVEFTHLEVD